MIYASEEIKAPSVAFKDPSLEEIVIVSTRSKLDILQAPSNVFVLGLSQLQRTQAEHVQQDLNQVPSVSLQRGDGQESLPGIRSAVLTGAGACGNVLVMEEGIPVRGPAFCNVNELFDTHFEQASQLEVVRGPGTAFYGSNSLTGSVNVILPTSTIPSVSFELGADNYKRLKASFAYAGHDSTTSEGAIYLTSTDTDSFRDDAGYRQHKLSWRDSRQYGDWRASSGLTATYLDQETAGFIVGKDSYLDEELSSKNLDPEAFRKTSSIRLWSKLSRDLEQGRSVEVTPYIRSTDMDFRLHFLPGDPLEQNKQIGFGWQSAYRQAISSEFKIAAGIDADFSRGELRQTQDEPTRGSAFLQATIPVGTHYDYRVDAQQLAAFAHLDWMPTQDLSVIGGARFERLDYKYDNFALDGRTRDDGTVCGFGGCRYSRPADRDDSFSDISLKLEVKYRQTDNLNFYAALSESFRAPQATELYRLQRNQQVADLDSVSANNIEAGFIYRSGALDFAFTVYQLDQTNVIIRDSDFFNVDGNRIESKGLEMALKNTLSDSLRLRMAATIAEHKYATDQITNGININGNTVDTAPKRQLNTALIWSPTDRLSAELELMHVSEYFLEPENLRTYPGHEVLNLRADYQMNDRFSIFARLLNANDKRYAERADFTGFTGERYFPGAPRSFFFGFKYDLTNVQ